jgi:hypothetical protein
MTHISGWRLSLRVLMKRQIDGCSCTVCYHALSSKFYKFYERGAYLDRLKGILADGSGMFRQCEYLR